MLEDSTQFKIFTHITFLAVIMKLHDQVLTISDETPYQQCIVFPFHPNLLPLSSLSYPVARFPHSCQTDHYCSFISLEKVACAL